MLKLTIPPALATEFETVTALWSTDAETRRVDSLILSWTKYEKQLRRLFSFLLYQHPKIDQKNIEEFVGVLAANSKLYPETFIGGIAALGVPAVPSLIGTRHPELSAHIERIKSYRNKLIHGQITGENIQSKQLEKDVTLIIEWIACLADGAKSAFGYDGLGRNTFRAAKASAQIAVASYPFSSPAELESWLARLVKEVKKAGKSGL